MKYNSRNPHLEHSTQDILHCSPLLTINDTWNNYHNIIHLKHYRIVPNKRAQRLDKYPSGLRRSRGAFWGFFSTFCSFLTNFGLFLVKYSTTKCWGRVYLSRCIYLALYGISTVTRQTPDRCELIENIEFTGVGICHINPSFHTMAVVWNLWYWLERKSSLKSHNLGWTCKKFQHMN